MQAKTFNPSAIFDENWYEDDRLYFYALENANSNTLKRIAAETVMSFTICSGQEVLPSTLTAFARQRADPGNVQEKIKKLEKSFQHSLSTIGQDALDVLKVEILDRFSSWKDLETTLIAPIASLSQGSGIGKSKLAVQVIQDGPGFYIVTRQSTESTGYPLNNDFSVTLKTLASNSDDIFYSFLEYPCNQCQNGQILLFFCKIITAYIRGLHSRVVAGLKNGGSDIEGLDLIRSASSDIGKLFEKNERIDCNAILNNETMTIDIWNNVLKLHQSIASEKKLIVVLPEDKFVPTVNGLAFYIKSILDNPSTSLSPEAQTNLCDFDRRAAMLIAFSLKLFPFIFVLDEADDLNRPSAQVPMDSSQSAVITGFEIIRRALSYLIPGTNIFFLTLGTRSDVHDLSPPSRENSQRLMRRRFTPKPIILLSNTSTFSKQEYPLEKLTISQAVLKNPVFFKLLATLGHPLWASRSFEAIVPLAESKLQNGSGTTLDYVLCIWMIRAGLAANPMDLNTRTLIASHMATLFDLDEELARMIVFILRIQF